MPIFRRSALVVACVTSPPRTGARKSAAVTGRGLVWWQMSAIAISTSRGICSRFDAVRRPACRVMPICCFSALQPGHELRRRRRCTSHGMRQLVELLRHGLVVPGQHRVDHQRVGQAMVQVADRAERVRAGVHRAQVLLEGDRAHHRAHHHVAARLQVARLVHRREPARARRCACLPARCRRTAGGRPATGSSRCCASARPCRWRPSRAAAGRASVPDRRTPPWPGSSALKTMRFRCVSSSLITARAADLGAGARGRRQRDEVRQLVARWLAPADGPRRTR